MTEQEFDALKPGDFVHHPAQPEDIWTVVGRQYQYDTLLAVKGRTLINNDVRWYNLLGTSEEICQELAKRYGIVITRMINHWSWTKKVEA